MSANVIETRGLGKRYLLGEEQAAYGSLRESLASALSPKRRRGESRDEIWALRDIDLSVRVGEAVGIIGTNGAGKSTLLRILARITEPSVGVARIRGRVGVMLEVGTGFHPELTGRENVYLSGAVMGMRRREIRKQYDDIVEFAGVERFLETPLKRYSSGMQLRLAFAVVAHLEPELMLVDEILAVGDVKFQRRCLERMNRLSEEGRTVIFVSHDLGAVTRLCSRAIWAEGGRVVRDGKPTEIVQAYYASLLGQAAGEAEFAVNQEVGVSHVAILDERGEVVERPARDESFTLQARVIAAHRVPLLDMGVSLMTNDGTVLIYEKWSDQPGTPELVPGPGEYLVRLKMPPMLRASDYVVRLWLANEQTTFFDRQVLRLSLVPTASDRRESLSRPRVVQPVVAWSHERLSAPR
jgi:ABC-type polysaccharide/polyol phosphate transport system ATPase subunit